MADEDLEKQKESGREKTDEKASGKSIVGRLLPWTIMAVVIAIFAGAGFGLGRMFGGSPTSETTESSQQNEPAAAEQLRVNDSTKQSGEVWYYPLEPVVANLDVPGVTRYVRASLVVAISSRVDRKEGEAFLEEKKPLLINWLTIYLASLNLEEIRGEKNLRRIQMQVLDAFNEKLFPDAKPQIERILFKEFAVQ